MICMFDFRMNFVSIWTFLNYYNRMSERQIGEETRLNVLDWINYDSQLSQFKHHFIIHRVHIPQLQFNEFATNLYKAFKGNLSPSSIYIVQIIETYDNFLYDIAIGFRRDADAINIFEKNRRAFISGKDVQIQLSDAFRIYLSYRQYNYSSKRSERKRRSHSSSSDSSSDHRRRRKQSYRRSRSRSNSYSSSRSKSKSPSISIRQRNRESFKGSFYLPLVPCEWGKQFIEAKLCEQLKCYRSDLIVDDKRGEFSSIYITTRSMSVFDELLNGVRIGDVVLLSIRSEQVDKNGLKVELKKYQFKAQRNESIPLQFAFEELAKFLLNFKQFHLRVVMITCLQNYFLVTTQTRISSILKFLKLNGWKFQPANYALKLNPSLQDRWYQYLKNNPY